MKVRLRKRVAWLDTSTMETREMYLQYWMDMPFCPPVGMAIFDGYIHCDVAELAYENEVIEAWAHAHEVELRPGEEVTDEMAVKLLAQYKKDGWELDTTVGWGIADD